MKRLVRREIAALMGLVARALRSLARYARRRVPAENGEAALGVRPTVEHREPEIHVFVLWERARPWAGKIIEDMGSRFRILDGIELQWTCDLASRHYTRLYGQSLPSRSQKVRECGAGFPLVLVVSDDEPYYAERRKWGRTSVVNARLFDAKQRYRRWAGGSSVHCSTDLRETEHDLFLLLGKRVADYAHGRPAAWSEAFQSVRRDPTGNGGWGSRDELFTAIDLTVNYVTLPAVDDGPGIRLLLAGRWPHWGVEWLIADPAVHPDGAVTRVYPVVVGGQRIEVKLHHVGDGHHDARWQKAMLEGRVQGADRAHVLAPSDAYLELFHELVRRGRATAGDVRRLDGLAREAGSRTPDLHDPARGVTELTIRLARRGYALVA